MRGTHLLLILLVGALCASGMAASAAEPGGGARPPGGAGGMPPGGAPPTGGRMGGPLGGPPIQGSGRAGPIRPGSDPSDLFSQPVRPGEPAERRGATISFRGTRYFVSEGQWFEQRGRRLIAVEAPAGVMVRNLPEGYAMRWIDGVPYFYAEGLYYIWREGERRYEILQVAPTSQMAPPSERGEGRVTAPATVEK